MVSLSNALSLIQWEISPLICLVVTLAGDADTETEGNALDTGFPDLLVQLGVDADPKGLHTTTVDE
jgi:hypothetical protein